MVIKCSGMLHSDSRFSLLILGMISLGVLLTCMCCLWTFKRRRSVIYEVVDVNRLEDTVSEGGVELLSNPWATDGEDSTTGQAEEEQNGTVCGYLYMLVEYRVKSHSRVAL